MKTIEIIISPTGEVRAETKGFAGASCLKATEELIKALGQQTAERKTAEMYQTEEQIQQRIGE